jgi:hypothetical protein
MLEPQGRGGGVGSVVEEGPAGRTGPGRRRRCPQAAPRAPAPAPPALSPKDTRYSAQSRASNQFIFLESEKVILENAIWIF